MDGRMSELNMYKQVPNRQANQNRKLCALMSQDQQLRNISSSESRTVAGIKSGTHRLAIQHATNRLTTHLPPYMVNAAKTFFGK